MIYSVKLIAERVVQIKMVNKTKTSYDDPLCIGVRSKDGPFQLELK